MPPTIHILDDALIDKIAAGEVVDRPSSVVKELLDNAIDAKASRIDIMIDDGGRERIVVSDNGVGMSAEDAALSMVRHATSKIRRFEDLQALKSMGFRGEALPSIASVSRFSLRTRTQSNDAGVELKQDGSGETELAPVGCPVGTTITVADLFYNVPARRKFLKARQTEAARIHEVCLKIALANPRIAIQVSSEGRAIRNYLHTSTEIERAQRIFAPTDLLIIDETRHALTFKAALGSPNESRRGPRGLHLFINGRPIQDARLARSVALGFRDTLPPGYFPIGACWLTIENEDVDFNAHPQKTEVRFVKSTLVYDTVARIVTRALPSTVSESATHSTPGYDSIAATGLAQALAENESEYTSAHSKLSTDTSAKSSFGGMKLLGISRGAYLICESDDALVLIDAHAADECSIFSGLTAAERLGSIEKRSLLFPERIDLDQKDTRLVENHSTQFDDLGIEIAMLGENTATVRAVPSAVGDVRVADLFRRIVNLMRDDATKEEMLAAMACLAASSRKEELSPKRALELLKELDEYKAHDSQPRHRHPIAKRIPHSELDGDSIQ